jgi:hypothetical protein
MRLLLATFLIAPSLNGEMHALDASLVVTPKVCEGNHGRREEMKDKWFSRFSLGEDQQTRSWELGRMSRFRNQCIARHQGPLVCQ